ncbi:MAG: HlyD family efflux transporter periplasmic adaptor subunit [Hyphomicrobiales bacterium]|nr:HlyD family efflux transporter periplasmic adaptor subunit [Hyphomicrobiales bacterium]
MPGQVEAQIFGLSTLLQLIKRARRATTLQELSFILVNETHSLLPYRQAVLWRREAESRGKVAAISGIPGVERNAPFTLWLNRALPKFDENCVPLEGPRPFGAGDLGIDAQEWAEWLPAYGMWVPLNGPSGRRHGALVLARERPWSDGERNILQELADGYAHAWAGMLARRRHFGFAQLIKRQRLLQIAIAAALLGALWMPVTLSALAPAEVVAFEPTIVRAPFEGVVDHFDIQPNQLVTQGQPLLELDPRAIENKLEVATKALSVAEAEYRQAAQQAWSDEKSRAQLALLKGRAEQRRSDVGYAKSLLERIHVTASRAGIALFDDPSDWIGKPVTIGEKLLEIADAKQAELEVWLPVADAITLKPGADVEFFLNIAPNAPLRATLRQASYEATLSPAGVLGYRLKARLVEPGDPPRIGLRGTAKIFGDRVTLFYYFARRPLAALRQLLGV